jgi:hypothetical protein
MAWTSPSTWVAGAVLTAAQLNAQVRDNMKAIGDPWTAYTPVWTGATTNPVIGNGTILGAYSQAGKMVNFWLEVTMGSTTTYGSGGYSITLPAAASESAHRWNFLGEVRDASASVSYELKAAAQSGSSGNLVLKCDPTTAGANLRGVTSAIPITLTTSDVLFVSGTYEAA